MSAHFLPAMQRGWATSVIEVPDDSIRIVVPINIEFTASNSLLIHGPGFTFFVCFVCHIADKACQKLPGIAGWASSGPISHGREAHPALPFLFAGINEGARDVCKSVKRSSDQTGAMKQGSLSHEEIAQLLAAHADRELPPELEEIIEGHLRACARCRRELALQKRISWALGREPVAGASKNLRTRVEQIGAPFDQPRR